MSRTERERRFVQACGFLDRARLGRLAMGMQGNRALIRYPARQTRAPMPTRAIQNRACLALTLTMALVDIAAALGGCRRLPGSRVRAASTWRSPCAARSRAAAVAREDVYRAEVRRLEGWRSGSSMSKCAQLGLRHHVAATWTR